MVALLVGVGIVTLGMLVVAPDRLGALLLLGAIGLLAVGLGLRSPVLACTYLLVTTLFRLAIPSGTLPVDPFLLAFAGVLLATWAWSRPWERRLAELRVDPITWAIALYIGWNVLSWALPHAYAPGWPRQPHLDFSVPRYLLIGTVMPLVAFLVGRRLFVTERAVRVLLWSTLAAAAYSAAMSVFQFTAPQLVWPTYILQNAQWPGRAVGVFSQPVVNGLVLVVGFLVAVLVASHDGERPALRICAALVGVASVYGVYLTHTRAVWLSFALIVLVGVVVARGFRTGFVLTGVLVAATVAANWSSLASADRGAGGVGSVQEVHDRLNGIATSIWAFQQEPLTGWGIGRFAAVNTHHHQQWSPAVPWERGLGISSHLDALGVLVELGIIGMALWLLVFGLVYARLVRATRRLPSHGPYGRALGLTALLCLVTLTTTGLTVDLRFFDFPNIVVMLFAGAAIGLERERARRADPDVPMSGPGADDVVVPARTPVLG